MEKKTLICKHIMPASFNKFYSQKIVSITLNKCRCKIYIRQKKKSSTK